jgi:hypothetical protein
MVVSGTVILAWGRSGEVISICRGSGMVLSDMDGRDWVSGVDLGVSRAGYGISRFENGTWVSVSVEARGGSSLRRCMGGDCAAEWKDEWVDVDSIEGDFRLDTRGGAR